MVTRRGCAAGAGAEAGAAAIVDGGVVAACWPTAAVTMGAAAITSTIAGRMTLARHPEADELLRIGILIARLDFEDVLARRQGRHREVDLQLARLRRGYRLQFLHRAAG